MRAFIDTSSLFKKYVDENGSNKMDALLENISEIIISQITILEINSILERRLREKSITASDAKWIEKEFLYDYDFFGVVAFSDALISNCIRIIRKYQLKVLDGLQLSSAIFSKSDVFIVSDKRLYDAAKHELKSAEFVG